METAEGIGADERAMLPGLSHAQTIAVPLAGEVRDGWTAPASVPRRPSSVAFPPVLAKALRRVPASVAMALAAERDRGSAFLFLPVLLCAGAAFYYALPFEPGFAGIGAALAILTVFGLAVRSSALGRIAAAALLVATLGLLAAKVETWRADTPMIGASITTVVTGRVVEVAHQAGGRTRLTIDVLATARPELRYAPDRIRVSARAAPDGIRPGDAVEESRV